jgi:hypothetical protein
MFSLLSDQEALYLAKRRLGNSDEMEENTG